MSFRIGSVDIVSVGVALSRYDNFVMTLSAGNTTETYLFKKGATSVCQWVLVYTDNTRVTLSSGVFTDMSA